MKFYKLGDNGFETDFNPKSTGLFGPGKALGEGCKILSGQPRALKLGGLIAYIMFYEIR